MNYVTEMYLNFLDERDDYQNIYENFLLEYLLNEVKPLTQSGLQGFLTKEKGALANLQQHKANLVSQNARPEVIAAVDAKIQAVTATVGKLGQKIASTADTPLRGSQIPDVIPMDVKAGLSKPPPGDPGIPYLVGKEAPSVAQQARARATPPDPQTQIDRAAMPHGSRTAPRGKPEPKDTTTHSPRTDKPAEPETFAQQATDTAKDVYAGAQDVVGKTAKDVAGAVKSGAEKLGVSPETVAKIDPGTVASAAASPLGMAALGGAAAFGGYKLYKRFLSKGARACRGYSGTAKTSCMKSYMGAKKGQASMRGAETAAAT
jgi:hypothetical protein